MATKVSFHKGLQGFHYNHKIFQETARAHNVLEVMPSTFLSKCIVYQRFSMESNRIQMVLRHAAFRPYGYSAARIAGKLVFIRFYKGLV